MCGQMCEAIASQFEILIKDSLPKKGFVPVYFGIVHLISSSGDKKPPLGIKTRSRSHSQTLSKLKSLFAWEGFLFLSEMSRFCSAG